ncbi:MAG TPA: ATPase, T2SS/T4P/T4SS family [Polyangia bacterium]|nr:ATPase, T2SS/T4P/T4SS family [Polyangia bacterium]
MFAIVVNEKGGEQKRLEFDKPEVTIGRVQGNDIILPKGNVSKRHSRIVLKDGKFIIVDLKSTNGTYVNGRKITSPLVVKGSDKIYIGDFILSIEELAAGASADDSASMGARPRANTIPPPPPAPRGRPSTVPGTEDDSEPMGAPPPAAGMGPMDDESGASELPEPVRPARPSQVPMGAGPASVTQPPTPAPLPPAAPPARSPSQPPPGVAPASRPASRTDLPSMAPRPSPVAPPPAAAPRPAPPPSRPPVGARPAAPMPAASASSTRRQASYASGAAEDQKRQRISDCMRDVSTRLIVQLDLAASRNAEVTPDSDLWARAESAASQMVADLSADGSLPAGVEPDALSKDVVQETLGVGPLEELLADNSVREIAVARHDRIFVEREGTLTLAPKWFSSPEAVERVLSRMLARAGRGRDLEAARGNGLLVEARVEHGLLLTAALPPLAARGPAITIRRPRREAVRLGDLVGQGLLSQGMADFLDLAVKARRNIVVSGPAASGRSTLVTALARAADEGERIVSVEESEELDLGDGPWIPLVAGRGQKARDAVNNALRLKPERLVVGDVRGAEALDLVGALAGGCDGCVCAVQAASTRDAVNRLTAMARLAPEAPAVEALTDELTRGVHVLVHLLRTAEGELRVGEIAEMTSMGVQPVFKAEGGRFAPTGHVPSWAEGAPPSTFR